MTKKTKRWLKIVIVIIIISILPIANVVSPFLITLPVFGRVTDDITGKPVEGAEVVSGLYKNVFNPVDAASSVEAGEIRVTTGSGGLYFIRPHIALKIPLINYFDSQFVGARTVKGENMDYRYQTDHEVYRNGDFFSPFLLFRMKNFVLMPRIANTKLCTNPGGDYRPDAKTVEQCKNNGIARILNNTPETCDSLQGAAYDEKFWEDMRRACKRDLAAIYQDVEREDGCSYDNYEDTGVPLPKADCIISKAVKYEDHDLCHYIYDKISDHNSAAYAPTIFEKYFGYGSYKQTGEMTYRDACLTMVAYRANDPVICDQVEYETERNMCRYFVKQRNIKSLDELEEL